MSFGFGVSDICFVIKLAKDTFLKCRKAPSDFAEASRVCQSLYLMLEAVETEIQNPDSPLHKDDRTRSDFAMHLRNCDSALQPLANLISKFTSLGTSNVRIIDRLRFSKKDYLEYRGNLSFYTTKLSEFLQMVGLGSLGRIEAKVEHIKESLPRLMLKIDQMCADMRINGDKQSLLSDHTDDEKFVWKLFRRRLNDAGFTSHVLREHEAEIFLRIRELTECGLLVSDGSSMAWTDRTETPAGRPTHVTNKEPPSLYSAPSPKLKPTPASSKRINSYQPDLPTPEQSDAHPKEFETLSTTHTESKTENSSVQDANHNRVWCDLNGREILTGRLAREVFRGGRSFVAIVNNDGEEVLLSSSNLSSDDLAYAEEIARLTPAESSPRSAKDKTDSSTSAKGKSSGQIDDDVNRNQPVRRCGKRTQVQKHWHYRQAGSSLPKRPPTFGRDSLTSDALPQAAAKGDLEVVRRLIKHGERIESKGPKSWTETTGGENSTSKRHSYPETTALYRAADVGWLEVAQFLLLNGADVDTRNGYDGRVGEPILFTVVRKSNEKMVRLLLEYGASTELLGPGSNTALHVASSYPKSSVVRLLLSYDAYINAQNGQGKTPLYLASDGDKMGGFARNVELLLREGAKVNVVATEGQTALYKASGKGREDIAELLLQYGADPDLGRGRHGETSLFKAAWLEDIEIVDLLLYYGADVNLRNNAKMKAYRGVGEKLLHGVMSVVSTESSFMNNWEKTALHAAAYRGNTDITQILLEAGADTELRGKDNLTPLYVGAGRKHNRVVQVLLKAGAKLNSTYDPVLALLDERGQHTIDARKTVQRTGLGGQMDRIGTDDKLVGFVANFAKGVTNSRRGEGPGLVPELLKFYFPGLAEAARGAATAPDNPTRLKE